MKVNKAFMQNQLDYSKESPLFYKIISLVSGGMFLDAIDVYLASAITSALLKSGWSTVQLNSYFLSSGFLGLFIGSIIAGIIGDKKGRRTVYQINLLLFGIFTFLGAFAPNMYFLIICRLIASIGLGSEIVTGYSMVNEFSPIKTRGKWCAIVSVLANCGAPATLIITSFILPNFGWRIIFMAIGIIAFIIWIMRRDIPESPRWLIKHGKYNETQKIINRMSVNDYYEHPNQEIKSTNKVVHKSMGNNLFVAIIIASATIICQYTFTSWVPTLLVKKGINLKGSLSASAFMMIGAPIGCAIGAYLVDKIGRKKTIIPAFFMTAIFGIIYSMQNTMIGVEMLGFLLNVCFYILMASVIAVYISELFPTKFRFRGSGIANGISKLFTVAMPIIVSWILTFAPTKIIFFSISIISAVAGIVTWVFGEETSQKHIN